MSGGERDGGEEGTDAAFGGVGGGADGRVEEDGGAAGVVADGVVGGGLGASDVASAQEGEHGGRSVQGFLILVTCGARGLARVRCCGAFRNSD